MNTASPSTAMPTRNAVRLLGKGGPSAPSVRISFISACIVFFIVTAFGWQLAENIFFSILYGGGIDRLALVKVVLPLVTSLIGAALAIYLSTRISIQGRPASAMGFLLLSVGPVSAAIIYFFIGYPSSWPVFVLIAGPCFLVSGIGVGLLLPAAFWQLLGNVGIKRRGTMLAAGFAGVLLGSSLGVAIFVLLVGLPAVLIAPVVRDD